MGDDGAPEGVGTDASGGDGAGSRASSGDGRDADGGFRRWISRPEVLVGLAAMILSLCGLFISIHETRLVRQEQRASVWPRVELGTSFRDVERVRFHVRNTGVGPARVRAASVSHSGEILENWQDLLRRVAGGEVVLQGRTYGLVNGRVLPPGSERETIYAIDEDDVVSPDGLVGTLQQAILDGSVDIEACYCSVYDECWTSSLQDLLRARRGEATPAGAAEVEDCEGAPRSGI